MLSFVGTCIIKHSIHISKLLITNYLLINYSKLKGPKCITVNVQSADS